MTPFKPWGTAPVSEHPACILPFEPNWSTPVQETLSWKTGTVMTQVGAEQRRALRREPRLGIQFESLLTASDVSLLQSILMGWAGRTFAVPLWYGKSTLVGGAAAGADFYLGLCPAGAASADTTPAATRSSISSAVTETISQSPSRRACSRCLTWPRCSTSKQPWQSTVLMTVGRPHPIVS